MLKIFLALEFFSSINRSSPLPVKTTFRTGLSPNSNKPYDGRRIYYDKKTTNTDRLNTQMVVNKATNGAVVSQVSKVLDQKLALLSIRFPDLISEKSLATLHPSVKNL